MNLKKSFLIITFLGIFISPFLISVPEARAITAEEIRTKIAELQIQIAALQKQLAELQAEEETWCHDFNVNLRYGDEGDEVKVLQTALQKEGFFNKIVTGYFGSFTASAVIGFQEKYKDEILSPWKLVHGTGYVGKTTIAKLNKLYGCVIPPKSLTLTSPNGGEKWTEGKTYNITWTSTGIDKVNICLLDDAQEILACPFVSNPCGFGACSNLKLIASEVSASLSKYSWTIPSSQAVGSKYKISILEASDDCTSLASNKCLSDKSDNYFSIASEEKCRDENYRCTIEDIPCCAGLKAVSLCNEGSSGSCICANCGSICRPCGNGVCDKNENRCNCPEDCEEKSLTLTSPNGGEKWTEGKTYNITWTSTGIDKVNICLLDDAQEILACPFVSNPCGFGACSNLKLIASEVSASLSKYSWTIPSSQAVGSKYKISILEASDDCTSLASNKCLSDKSDNYFSIAISCKDSLDCPSQMKCENSICFDVGCIEEGEFGPSAGINPEWLGHLPTKCCEGLISVSYSGLYDENCNLTQIVGAPSMACTKCGDGQCGKGETKCNCPQDCKTSTTSLKNIENQ
jgi:hypothetical protein